jgi:hypothetical protein
MLEFFSSPEPLQWLKELRPRHLDFKKPWDSGTRTKALRRDIERDLAYLQNLLIRLDNYDEETAGTG